MLAVKSKRIYLLWEWESQHSICTAFPSYWQLGCDLCWQYSQWNITGIYDASSPGLSSYKGRRLSPQSRIVHSKYWSRYNTRQLIMETFPTPLSSSRSPIINSAFSSQLHSSVVRVRNGCLLPLNIIFAPLFSYFRPRYFAFVPRALKLLNWGNNKYHCSVRLSDFILFIEHIINNPFIPQRHLPHDAKKRRYFIWEQ